MEGEVADWVLAGLDGLAVVDRGLEGRSAVLAVTWIVIT